MYGALLEEAAKATQFCEVLCRMWKLDVRLCLQLKQKLDDKAAEVAEVATELAEKVIAHCNDGSPYLC